MDLFGDAPVEEVFEAEDYSEDTAEPVEGLQEPRRNVLCRGHDAVEAQLLALANEGRMPHAVIFSGAEGIGKATMAFRLARFMLTRGVDDPNQDSLFGAPEPAPPAESMDMEVDHPVFSRVASGGHADLLVVGRKMDDAKGKRAASVEVAEIRKVAPFLRLSASEGGWRVVIIDDADTMNRNAQNALLKILEEPPPHVLIILVAHRAGALIPTIRSRARVVTFEPLGDQVMTELLQVQNHFLAQQEMEALSVLAEGSLGRALALLEEGGLDSMGKVMSVFEQYPDWKGSDIHALAEELARVGQDQAFMNFQSVMQWIARQLATAKARGQGLPGGPMGLEVFQALLGALSLERLMGIYDDLKNHFDHVNRANLEKRQAVLQAFAFFKA